MQVNDDSEVGMMHCQYRQKTLQFVRSIVNVKEVTLQNHSRTWCLSKCQEPTACVMKVLFF